MQKEITIFIFIIFFSLPVFAQKEMKIEMDLLINWLSAEWINPQDQCDSFYLDPKAAYIAQGILLKGGTLKERCEPDENGLLNCGFKEDGSFDTEFVDKDDDVIGEWHCRGWFTYTEANQSSGVFDLSTQIFILDLDEFPDPITIVSDGTVILDFFKPHKRVITGTSNIPNYSSGDVTVQTVGVNSSIGANLFVTFDLILNE